MSSYNSFADFHLEPSLLEALKHADLHKPMLVQQEVIPQALEGSDLLVKAPTGTGKTLAFLIPAIQKLLNKFKSKQIEPRILIVTPTRELALQITKQAKELAQFTPIKVANLIGGVEIDENLADLEFAPQIVVATPGRLLKLLKIKALKLNKIETLIFDEADKMMQMGFGQYALEIDKNCINCKQKWLFSATLESKELIKFFKETLNEPIYIETNPSRAESKKIQQWYHHCDDKNHKIALLIANLQKYQVEKGLIFVNKKIKITEILSALTKQGIKTAFLEGDMPQENRKQVIEKFSNNNFKVLIATDLASRGLHIDNIDLVINFDLPYKADTYIHRIGRTARAGKKGLAISLVEAHEYPLLGKIERYSDQILKPRIIKELAPKTKEPKNKELKISKQAKQKRKQQQAKANNTAKAKIRLIQKKNIGHRRKPSNAEHKPNI